MTLLAGLLAWWAAAACVAALAGLPSRARVAWLPAVAILPLPALVAAGPLGLTVLSSGIVILFVRTWDLVAGPVPPSFGARLVHLFVPFDSRLAVAQRRRLEWRQLLKFSLAAIVVVVTFEAMASADGLPTWVRYVARSALGGAMVLAGFEALTSAVHVAARLSGFTAPALSDRPHRSRSIAEFWGKRWNLSIAAALRQHCFAPLARHGTAAVLVTFAASAAGHAYMIGFVVGPAAALSWAAFFMAQPLLMAAERALHLRRWPDAARRVWTVGALLAVLPLFVEPAIELFADIAAAARLS